MRSYGTKTKVSPNQVKIGSVKSGLYYDKDLPFIQKIPTVLASGKRKGKKELKYRLRAEQSPDDLIMVHFWEGGKQVFKPMKRKHLKAVKDPKTGNVKKVNFGHGGTSAKRKGEKTMKIRKSNPKARKNFRARHNCDNPGPKWKARYWSCKAW